MKDIPSISERDFLLTEAVLKVSAIERLLIKSKIFTQEELTKEMSEISAELVNYIKNNLPDSPLLDVIKKDN